MESPSPKPKGHGNHQSQAHEGRGFFLRRKDRPEGPSGLAHAVGRVPSRGGKDAVPPSVPGRGVLPLDVIQPEPRRLRHISAG